MIYESVVKEKKLEDNFYKRMSLYLKSKSIDEYCVQRDMLNIKDNWIDDFWLWYMYKEKKHVLVGYWLLSMIGTFILFALLLMLCGGLWRVGSGILAAISFVLHIFIACGTSKYVKHFGHKIVPYSISKDRDRDEFEDVDRSMSYKLINNENQ